MHLPRHPPSTINTQQTKNAAVCWDRAINWDTTGWAGLGWAATGFRGQFRNVSGLCPPSPQPAQTGALSPGRCLQCLHPGNCCGRLSELVMKVTWAQLSSALQTVSRSPAPVAGYKGAGAGGPGTVNLQQLSRRYLAP